MSGSTQASGILRDLEIVAVERRLRRGSQTLWRRVDAVKRYQQARLRLTYEDLLRSERYGPAAEFFLEELYGPADFTHRDAQFARIVPRLVRMLPAIVTETVRQLAELHALSEQLDSAMGICLEQESLDSVGYVRAWQAVGRVADRARQIDLVIKIGRALDGFAHLPMLVTSLRIMRGPARAAGLADLQHILERGLDAFKAMDGANEFLALLEDRERKLANAMFSHQFNDADSGHEAEALSRGLCLP